MGDFFFILRMLVYTFIMVVILQVKVGPTTLEEKLYGFTHESQLAGTLQGVAQGAATFIGVQYNRLAGKIHSQYIEQHSSSQRPGERLQSKLREIKSSMNEKWKDVETKLPEYKQSVEDQIGDTLEGHQDSNQ